jgi:hypothetical protein
LKDILENDSELYNKTDEAIPESTISESKEIDRAAKKIDKVAHFKGSMRSAYQKMKNENASKIISNMTNNADETDHKPSSDAIIKKSPITEESVVTILQPQNMSSSKFGEEEKQKKAYSINDQYWKVFESDKIIGYIDEDDMKLLISDCEIKLQIRGGSARKAQITRVLERAKHMVNTMQMSVDATEDVFNGKSLQIEIAIQI